MRLPATSEPRPPTPPPRRAEPLPAVAVEWQRASHALEALCAKADAPAAEPPPAPRPTAPVLPKRFGGLLEEQMRRACLDLAEEYGQLRDYNVLPAWRRVKAAAANLEGALAEPPAPPPAPRVRFAEPPPDAVPPPEASEA
jgi:hypothetical protein